MKENRGVIILYKKTDGTEGKGIMRHGDQPSEVGGEERKVVIRMCDEQFNALLNESDKPKVAIRTVKDVIRVIGCVD
jgi:hypothetical protein